MFVYVLSWSKLVYISRLLLFQKVHIDGNQRRSQEFDLGGYWV